MAAPSRALRRGDARRRHLDRRLRAHRALAADRGVKASFLTPLPIGTCIGEGRIFKAGRQIVFADGRLLSDGQPAVIATATLIRP